MYSNIVVSCEEAEMLFRKYQLIIELLGLEMNINRPIDCVIE